MNTLLYRIADALNRHHETLAELASLAEEFQDQVGAMRAQAEKVQEPAIIGQLEEEMKEALKLPRILQGGPQLREV